MSHIRKNYECAGKPLFEDHNAFYALGEIFVDILLDSNLKKAYLVIDVLDECETGLPQLLGLVVQSASTFPHVKWIVSSHNKSDIEEQLGLEDRQVRLSLELNAEHVSRAVEMFIGYKVSQLASIKHNSTLQNKVRVSSPRNSARCASVYSV
jgi:hypothetical protein